jgi:hypothetical protein
MIAISAILTWQVAPALGRAALLRAKAGRDINDAAILQQFQRLITLNVLLGMIILVFTALARIS